MWMIKVLALKAQGEVGLMWSKGTWSHDPLILMASGDAKYNEELGKLASTQVILSLDKCIEVRDKPRRWIFGGFESMMLIELNFSAASDISGGLVSMWDKSIPHLCTIPGLRKNTIKCILDFGR
ncbi:hypothetical protein V6N11_064192 [Hibiscus sabdariffa]|uniref:Uncharacterized protein n=1 Tax=Hibiscus sabdariffa TaxID=183260 RepID=A0ABR2PNC9_9ROSI